MIGEIGSQNAWRPRDLAAGMSGRNHVTLETRLTGDHVTAEICLTANHVTSDTRLAANHAALGRICASVAAGCHVSRPNQADPELTWSGHSFLLLRGRGGIGRRTGARTDPRQPSLSTEQRAGVPRTSVDTGDQGRAQEVFKGGQRRAGARTGSELGRAAEGRSVHR